MTERLFRLVVRLYPSEFRDRFGDDLNAAYREARMHAAMRGRRDAAAFWMGVAGDAFIRAPGEHMRMLWHDLRFAARALRRTPAFTLVSIATLALGIGANTAIFSVVRAVALQQLPYRDPDRLVRVWEKNEKLQIPRFAGSVPNYVSWRERAQSFESLAAWRGNSATLTTGGDPQRLAKIDVTANMLPMLGISPIAGRTFSADEDRPGGSSRVAMFADTVWRDRFGGNPDILGKSVTLDGNPFTVIGIFRRADFVVPIDVAIPLAADLSRENRSNHMMTVVGRLKPGVTIAQAQREMDGIALQLGREYPKDDADWGVTMASAYDWLVPQNVRTGLYVLLASVALVLLIACTNIANLTLARSAARRRDQAVRLALGAGRSRIVREVLTESILLSTAGGVAGVALAYWALPVFRSRLAAVLPRTDGIALNATVLLFALAVSVITGALFGALPAFMNSRRDVLDALKDGTRGGTQHHGFVRRLLVVAQLALATILLAGAALLVQSFIRLQHVNLGFAPDRITTAMTGLPRSRYPNHAAGWQFYSRAIQEIASAAEVQAVGLSSGPPLAGGNTGQPATAVGPNALGTKSLQADWRMVSPDFFKAMGIPILRGRSFTDEDREGAAPVVILSANMARKFWPSEDAVGHYLNVAGQMRIVGVVGDVRSANQAIDPSPTMYLSTTQYLWPAMAFVVRTRGNEPIAPLVRRVVSKLDPELAVFNVRTMDTILETSTAQPRLAAWLVGGFALLALLLAAIGVYGVLAYLVAQRTREIGVRIALGARPTSVLRLVAGHSLRLSLAGIALGVLGALALGPAIESQLYNVRPRDAVTLTAVAFALVVVASFASYVPARRATRVDPLTALRSE